MKFKKLLSVIYLTCSCSFLTFADTGEGISAVGTLSSFNNSNTIIITHGFTANNLISPISASKWKHYVWQFAMADAVSNNRDIYLIRKGEIWKSLATYGNYQDFTTSLLEENIETLLNNSSYFTNQFTPESNKDNVFIFDWTLESGVNKHGYAEAAADILAAELIKLGIDDPFLLEHLHFIGHSRGTVVNSETIERLIYLASNGILPNGINLDQNIHMTTLDPHPAGHWSRRWWWSPDFVHMDDDKVNSKIIDFGVVGWKSNTYKVTYIDNYYQDDYVLTFKGLDSFPGLDFSDLTANSDLSSILPQNSDAHGLVHTWFHGTVSSVATNDAFGIGVPNIERNDWYNSDLGKSQGFYYSLNRPGNLQNILSIQDDLIDVSVDDKYGNEHLVFNGDFIKGDDVNALFGTDPFPGWSYQDGITPSRGGTWNPSALISNDHNLLVHNSLYIPKDNVENIYFRMRVTLPSSVDVLNLYIGNTIIGAYAINNATLTKKWYSATIPGSLLGTVNQIKFEKTNNEVSALLIDDVSFLANERFRSTVACPVDFHIYDQLGNHTGPINDTTFVEEIPGSEYYVYQDSTGDRSKTVYLEPLEGNENYTFIIESRDTTASFDYEIEDYSDATQGTIIYQFSNIAIEPNTVATCSLDVNIQIPELEVDIDGDGTVDSTYTPVVIISGVNDESQVTPIPTRYELFNNYPNPFNPTTTISYSIPEVSNVSLKVYDVLGNEIATLVNEEKVAGYYSVQFDSKNLSSGIYIYTLQTGTYTATKKMILLK